jgi:predicted lysophospholipase L1 biosynthesis ABC-type transport system permease subunit
LRLIACVNVANLMLANATARGGELAVRTALGASRLRLARQLVIEALLITTASGALAVLLAHGVVGALRRFGPAGIPRLDEVSVDATVLGGALAVATLVGVLFGVVPLLRATADTLTERLRGAGRGTGGGGQRLRGALVVAEVALSVLLVVGAALLMRSYARLSGVDPGFDAAHLLAARVQHPEARLAQPGRVTEVQRRIEERLAALPGVDSVGATNALPIVEFAGDTRAFAVDRPPAEGQWTGAQVRAVTAGYFTTMGIPIQRGRAFDVDDRDGAEPVVIVNDAMAAAFFPGEDPIGKVLMVGLSALISGSVAEPRFRTAALGLFAAVALALAAIGVYGVLAYAVASRSREIGIRIALGARRNAVIGMVVGRGLLLAAAGLALGLVGAVAATRLLRTVLFGVGPLDGVAFTAAPITLALVALLASWIPARRAARVDPAIMLRD